LNDIIDRRRDQQISPNRPLPSGRISLVTAHFICGALLLGAVACAIAYGSGRPSGRMTLLLVTWTAMLIAFYDFAGKYLVFPGLLTLGLVRFFHAVIVAPQLPLVWHPLWLLNHVTLLSAWCYQLEQKRPTLTRAHWIGVIGGLITADAVCLAAVWWRRQHRFDEAFLESLRIEQGLIWPALATAAFLIAAAITRRRVRDSRAAGQTLMLQGLLWLILYDAAFAAGFVGVRQALTLLLLLPAGYLSVQLMRWWGRIVTLSQKPTYQRARSL
jgi:hypothetical protein